VSRGRTAGRIGGLLAAPAVLVAMTPGLASAHSVLLGTAPADTAVVTTVIGEVTLTFNETVHAQFSTVVVTGPGDVTYSDGPLRVLDAVVHQSVFPLRSGGYRVAWRVVSADGHPVSGTFGFTVALPAGLEPTATPPNGTVAATASAAVRSTWWWAVLAVLGVVLVGVLALRSRRGRGS
jgi:methionine-rich copper-binding protein CopC